MVQVSSIKQAYDQTEFELNLSRSKLKECDTQISCIAKEQQNLQQKLSDAAVERKKMENEVLLVKRMEIEQKEFSLKVNKLLEKHGWIATEKQLFGKSGTDYDFSAHDPSKSREELEKMQAQQSGSAFTLSLS
ncbi:hypothetical protein BHM03_00036719 [Ensete ventricosum]|nr:hypothetical protein BHM03_00036719 [Ensete ventricosum]